MIYFLCYPLVFVFFRLLARILGRVRSSGEHHVPAHGPVIYCPNHISDADPPTVFVCVPRRAWYLGKSELFAVPGVGWFFAHFRGIPIKRDSADRAALRRAEAILRRGEALVIFPEGRCSERGTLQRIQPGAALLSVRTGAKIVPIGLRHTNEMLPYRAQFPRFARHAVRVDFGPAIDPTEFAKLGRSGAIAAITQKLGEELARLTDQPAPTTATNGHKLA
jgi:1-acyl-sn-glycerol-3-phosphate acyltransferase